MKKITWIEIIVVLALVAGWFYMEKTESLTIFVKEDMTKEEILAEMPEIAVTEQDEKLEDYVMGLPEVQELLSQPAGGSIPNEKEEALLSDFLAEGDLLTGFGVVDHDVYLDIKQGEKNSFPIPLTAQEPSLCGRSSGCMNSGGTDGRIQLLMKPGGIPM